MRSFSPRFCLVWLLVTGAASAADLQGLGWLSGAWVTTRGKTVIEEHWTKPSGGRMLGTGHTVIDGRSAEFEFLRIEQRGPDLYYIAQPNGAPPTEFKLVKSTASEVVFENLQHDFPQQISYTRNEDGSVTARTSGPGKQGPKTISFEYKRAK